MKILDGKRLGQEISEKLKLEIATIKNNDNRELSLAILQVGNNSASNIYIRNKITLAEKIGIRYELIRFEDQVDQSEIIGKIESLNSNPNVTGIILQLPIPGHLNKNEIINKIHPSKDVDGLGEINLAKLINGDDSGIVPATAAGIITILQANNIKIEGKNVVVVGRSILVGKTTALSLLNHNASVTICHSFSQNLDKIIYEADIIVSATGLHGTINKNNTKEGQILVDVGISFLENKMVGDSDLSEEDRDKLRSYTPVPGGVGPMTVISLFNNLLKAHELQKKPA